jgi:myo-inositol-1(or 4)-monophosphatase
MNQNDFEARLEVAIAVAREAGSYAAGMFERRSTLDVESKGPQDRVTIVDKKVETLIRDAVSNNFPDDHFFGEESGHDGAAGIGVEPTWVVDPIDGTDCFIFGLPSWTISIAWLEGGVVRFGIIYDPVHDEMYSATLGKGAFINGEPLKASSAKSARDGLVGIGHSGRIAPATTLAALDRLFAMGGMFHRCGSGALSLAWVAAGRLIAYFEPHINSWDCLAGLLLVREAGGWTNDFLDNDGLFSGNPVLASAPGMISQIRSIAGLEGQIESGVTDRES